MMYHLLSFCLGFFLCYLLTWKSVQSILLKGYRRGAIEGYNKGATEMRAAIMAIIDEHIAKKDKE